MGRKGQAYSERANLNHCSVPSLLDTLLRQNVSKQITHVNFGTILLLSVQEAMGLKKRKNHIPTKVNKQDIQQAPNQDALFHHLMLRIRIISNFACNILFPKFQTRIICDRTGLENYTKVFVGISNSSCDQNKHVWCGTTILKKQLTC
jgi:hypothetical protein